MLAALAAVVVELVALVLAGRARGDVAGIGAAARVERSALGRGSARLRVGGLMRSDVAGIGAAAVLGRGLFSARSGEGFALVLVVAAAVVVELVARVVDVAGRATVERVERSACVMWAPRIVAVAGLLDAM